MQKNWIKNAIEKKEVVFGTMVGQLRTPMLGQILDAANTDFAIIDQEHGTYGPDMLSDILAAFKGGRCLPIVRIPAIRKEYFCWALDQGAQGIMVPSVETGEEAKACISYCKFPPLGERGFCSLRAHSSFIKSDAETFRKDANENLMLVLQIETARALDNLDEIFSVPGIDVAFIGCADLAASLSVPNSRDSKELNDAVKLITAKAKEYGITLGIHAYDPLYISELTEQGFHFVSCQTDIKAVLDGFTKQINDVKSVYTNQAS